MNYKQYEERLEEMNGLDTGYLRKYGKPVLEKIEEIEDSYAKSSDIAKELEEEIPVKSIGHTMDALQSYYLVEIDDWGDPTMWNLVELRKQPLEGLAKVLEE